MTERTFHIIAFAFVSMTGATIVSCSAELELPEGDTRAHLFDCPENWIPETKQEFLDAAAYHGYEFDKDVEVIWMGFAPY